MKTIKELEAEKQALLIRLPFLDKEHNLEWRLLIREEKALKDVLELIDEWYKKHFYKSFVQAEVEELKAKIKG